MVVCDGISSASAGDVAARTAAAPPAPCSAQAIGDPDGREPAIVAAIRAAGDAVGRSRGRPASSRGPVLHARLRPVARRRGHDRHGRRQPRLLGRSRRARQLTVDDSWAQEQIDKGRLTPEQASNERSALDNELDRRRRPPRSPRRLAAPGGPGRLVLCTDGLWNYLADAGGAPRADHGLPPRGRAGRGGALSDRHGGRPRRPRQHHRRRDRHRPEGQEDEMSRFAAECYQNEYLPAGGSEVNAIVTVTTDGAAGERQSTRGR